MRRVLIVDDNEAIRDSLADALEGEGWTVRAVSDGVAAVAAATTESPDVVLLDLMMPGLDGADVACRLREAGCRASIVVLSADRWGEARAKEVGAAAFMPKPFELDALLGLLERLAPR